MTQNSHITLKEKLVHWASKKLHGWKQYVCKHPVKICCIIMILLYTGNILYWGWGKPVETSPHISPDGKYKIIHFWPKNSFYGWMTTATWPYFSKVYVFENNKFRYACTSPILDEAGMRRIFWPSDGYDKLSDNLEYSIPAKPLREGFISFAPTLERICPNTYPLL